MTPKEMMKTTTNTAATRDQVREPTRELTEDELVLVSGGTPSSASNDWRCHIHPNYQQPSASQNRTSSQGRHCVMGRACLDLIAGTQQMEQEV